MKYIKESICKDFVMVKENIHSKTIVGMKVNGRMASNQEKASTVKDMIRLKVYGEKVNLLND